jgi:hypothetical protein
MNRSAVSVVKSARPDRIHDRSGQFPSAAPVRFSFGEKKICIINGKI